MFSKLKFKKPFVNLSAKDWLFILAGLLIFSVITLLTITKFSIWFDEAFGAYMIKFSFFDIARYTAADVHPPLFYWLLKIWSMVFGNSELALRSTSLLFGCIAIIFGYLLTNKLFGKKAARLSLLFMVLSPMLVRYSQEARMYTMVMAIATSATYILVCATENHKKSLWTIYGILIAIGLWTHYFIFVVWLAHWIWRAIVIWRESKLKHFWHKFFAEGFGRAYLLAIILFLPWLPFAIKQTFVVQAYGFWIPSVTANTIPNFMTNVLYYLDSNEVKNWLTFGFALVISLLAVLSIAIYRRQNDKWRQSYLLISSVAFVPILVLFLMSMPPFRSYFIDRYLITSALFIAIFAGVTFAYGLKLILPKLRYILLILIVVLLGIGITNVWRLGNYNKNTSNSNNTRDIIEAVYKEADSGESIISSGLYIFYEEVFYENSQHSVYFIAPDNYSSGSLAMLKDNNLHKITDMTKFVKDHKKVWYVGWCGDNEDSFAAPYSNWKKLREVSAKDSVSGKATYKAIEYQTN